MLPPPCNFQASCVNDALQWQPTMVQHQHYSLAPHGHPWVLMVQGCPAEGKGVTEGKQQSGSDLQVP